MVLTYAIYLASMLGLIVFYSSMIAQHLSLLHRFSGRLLKENANFTLILWKNLIKMGGSVCTATNAVAEIVRMKMEYVMAWNKDEVAVTIPNVMRVSAALLKMSGLFLRRANLDVKSNRNVSLTTTASHRISVSVLKIHHTLSAWRNIVLLLGKLSTGTKQLTQQLQKMLSFSMDNIVNQESHLEKRMTQLYAPL